MEVKETPINQWIQMNKDISRGKRLNMTLAIGIILVSLIVIGSWFKPPVVVMQKDGVNQYYSGDYQDLVVSNDDAAKFIKEFIQARYIWKHYNANELLQTLKPYVTDAFYQIAENDCKKEAVEMEKLKNVDQNVVNIEVTIDKGRALARFDRVIRINNLPLVSPTEISFNIIKGTRSKWNPVGLYVHGIVEHSDK